MGVGGPGGGGGRGCGGDEKKRECGGHRKSICSTHLIKKRFSPKTFTFAAKTFVQHT